MTEPAIEIRNLSKRYGRKEVLKNISGSVEYGKVVGLLGRNGEGKTTLFRILLDILEADSGAARVMGMTPDGTSKIRKFVGYIPERPAFHEFMKIGEVLQLRASFFPNWDWHKARDLAERLELDLTTSVKGASKGTLAKTAWICATAHNPQLLILDEPTSGLDALVRDSVLSHLVRELSEQGRTILVTNHHMEELLGVLDEVWVISGGRIVGTHSLEELKHSCYQITGRCHLPDSRSALNLAYEQKMGELVQWVVMDKETLHRIQQEQILSQIEIESLPLDKVFKLLLAGGGERHIES